MCKVVFAFLFLFQLTQSGTENEPEVMTTKGLVVGLNVDHSHITGAEFRAFLGIPYGDQPVRFQLAKPRTLWIGPLKAQKDGPACPQPSRLPTSEDCLYLNVFTPLHATPDSKLPVMVFIHGSAFTYSSSYSKKYGPDFLVPQGVILVAMNYRLGALGFLTLGNKLAPGNLGLHDTLLALQWVQNEISAFGGDPDNVTLFGQSAGAAITLAHYVSPISAGKGLFKRAIAQSGSLLADWAHYPATEGARRARLLAWAVDCDPWDDDLKLLLCLQKVDIHELVDKTYMPLDNKVVIPGAEFPFLPVLDNALWSNSPFFGDSLEVLMRKALSRALPLMMGFNNDEGIFVFDDEERWKLAESHLEAFIPQVAKPFLTEDRRNHLAEDIRNHYLAQKHFKNKIEDIIRLYTDILFAFPVVEMANYFKKFTYGYVFAYDGSWRIPNIYFSQFNISGVAHGDETPYLFAGKSPNQSFDNTKDNAANLLVKDLMAKLWTQFAKTGIPSCSWKPLSHGNYQLIDSIPFDYPVKVVEARHFNFWDNIIKKAKSTSCTFTSELRMDLRFLV